MRILQHFLISIHLAGFAMAQDRPVIEVGAPIDTICAAYDCYDHGQSVAEPNRFIADTVNIKVRGIEYKIRMDASNTYVDEIRTRDPAFQSPAGIKVGSTYEAFKATYPDHTTSFLPHAFLIATTDTYQFLFVFRNDLTIQDQDRVFAVNLNKI